MNAELWQELHDGIEDYDGNSSAWDGFNAALEAMRKPITPEALRADGWNAEPEGTWSYRVDLLEWILIERRGDAWELITTAGVYPLTGVHNMYDVRELVRILGGAQ